MSRDYEGKIGIGQLLLCLLAAATLCIPYMLEPQMEFTFNRIMPIGDSAVSADQGAYLMAILEQIGIASAIPETIFKMLPYTIYAFYGIIAFDIVFTLFMMILRSEIIRHLLRALSILLGLALLVLALVNLLTVAGFFAKYLSGGFGEREIFDCIKNNGLLFFIGLTVFSFICMAKQFSSFFGTSH
ncbi:MAG: hypothetical protein VZQ61_01370 [Christensenellaceae bacterium]